MPVTYGFYDSLGGDRKYNAKQMSQLFKGIISDGVFATVGGGLVVTPNTGMTLNVASGRAWFNNTWTDNDSTYVVTVLASEAVLNRIDAVVIEVNSDIAARVNSIKVIKGTPATNPLTPTMANTATLHQYPLAFVSVPANTTSLSGGNLTNMIGTGYCPFASGAVPTFNFGPLIDTWQSQFTSWFNNLVNQLSGSQVANLQAQIDVLNSQVGRFDNYIITPSISANSLLFELKTRAGTNPSASDKIRFRVGNTVYDVTSPVSFLKTPGNWMLMSGAELNNYDVDLFVYAVGESGGSPGIKFGFSRIPYANIMGHFSSTDTDPKYLAGNWTNFNVTDPVTVIGRFRARITNTNWSIPVPLVINEPIFRTGNLNWTPNPGGFVPGTPVSNTAYAIEGSLINYYIDIQGTSNNTGFNFLLPFPLLTGYHLSGWAQDNNSFSINPPLFETGSGNSVTIYLNGSTAGWTPSNTKRVIAKITDRFIF